MTGLVDGWLRRSGLWVDRLLNLCARAAAILLAFTVAAVCADVVCRYALNKPIPWVPQVTEYILLYIPFLAAAWVLREEAHVKVDLLLNRLKPKNQLALTIINSLVGLCVTLVLSYYGLTVTVDYYIRKVPTLEYYKMPEWIVIAAIPVGSILLSVQFIRRLHKTLSARTVLTKRGEYPRL